jgi:hypothetical protein
LKLRRPKLARLTRFECPQSEWSQTNPDETADAQTNGLTHQANLALVTFVDDDAQGTTGATSNLSRTGDPLADRNTLAQSVDLLVRRIRRHPDFILPLDLVTRMEDMKGEVAVIREKK